MNNVTIKETAINTNLDRKLMLNNGTLLIVRHNDIVSGVYMVISFRDNKNRYDGANTTNYCSLVDLDNGQLPFEERCSRSTTVRRVLNHILRLGYTMPYNPNSRENDSKMNDYDIELYVNGTYQIEIGLKK